MSDEVTQSWIKNESDRQAVAQGCYFSPKHGDDVVNFIERLCHLSDRSLAWPEIEADRLANGFCASLIFLATGQWETQIQTCIFGNRQKKWQIGSALGNRALHALGRRRKRA